MIPAKIGIELDQGATFSLIVQINNVTCTPPNPPVVTPIDITGYSFVGVIRPSTDLNYPYIVQFTFTLSNQSTNKGQVVMSLTADQTNEIFASISNALRQCRLTTPYVYNVDMTDTAGNITRIMEGIVQVSPTAIRGGL